MQMSEHVPTTPAWDEEEGEVKEEGDQLKLDSAEGCVIAQASTEAGACHRLQPGWLLPVRGGRHGGESHPSQDTTPSPLCKLVRKDQKENCTPFKSSQAGS